MTARFSFSRHRSLPESFHRPTNLARAKELYHCTPRLSRTSDISFRSSSFNFLSARRTCGGEKKKRDEETLEVIAKEIYEAGRSMMQHRH